MFAHRTFPTHHVSLPPNALCHKTFPATKLSCDKRFSTTKRNYEGSSGENIFIENVFLAGSVMCWKRLGKKRFVRKPFVRKRLLGNGY